MAEGKIRVFHVLTDCNIGGAGRWLLNYLKYYNRQRFEVWVILPSGSALEPAVMALEVPVISVEDMDDSSYDKKAKATLYQLFRQEKPDIVHTHASLTARMAAKKAKIKKIINTKHCMEVPTRSLPKKIVRRIVNKRYSHTIIAVSEAVKQSMVKGGTKTSQIVTIYNGIDGIVPISAEKRDDILWSYGGDPTKKAVGIVARLEEVKDHKTFLLAAKEVLRFRKDISFYIIGDGSLRNSLEEQVNALGIAGNVVFTGFVEKVERLESALDLNVITSTQEALCLSLIETMSAGIPAIGTDSGGVNEVICHGENGYLVAVGDWKDLADRIMEVLANEGEYLRLGMNARNWTMERFTAFVMAAKIERLYLEGKK